MSKKTKGGILLLYSMVLFFLVFKMFFYEKETTSTPDEAAHVGYILYLKANPDIIVPEFENMNRYVMISEKDEYETYRIIQDEWNYLGHSPLYYHLMKPFTKVNIDAETVTVNTGQLRTVNILLIAVGATLACYLGFTRIIRRSDRIIPHVIFLCSLVSIPMLAYTASGVNNDNLAFLGVVLFFWGILRYYEDRVDWQTYLLVGIGFCVSILVKLTVGEILVITLLIVVISDLICKRGFKAIKNRYFVATLILYILPVSYYLFIYVRYGTFQPSLQVLHPSYYYTMRYVAEGVDGRQYTLVGYFVYYWKEFWHTWVSLYSHKNIVNKFGDAIGWIGPSMVMALGMLQAIRSCIKKKEMSCMYVAFWGGIVATMVTQFASAYREYCAVGYMGGFQARYYLCVIPFLAYSNAMLWCEDKSECDMGNIENQIKTGGCRKKYKVVGIIKIGLGSIYTVFLLYGDFIYLLIYGKYGMR